MEEEKEKDGWEKEDDSSVFKCSTHATSSGRIIGE
jgi:hypothetical protein